MILLGAALTVAAIPTSRPVAYTTLHAANAWFHVVIADPSSRRVTVRTDYAEGLVSPWWFIQKSQPAAAITGVFFNMVDGTPVGDLLLDGELAARGNRGNGIAIDYLGNLRIFDRPFRRGADWQGFRWGLRGAVRLLARGRFVANPQAQAFRDPRIWGRASRTGIGLTAAGKLLLMATTSQVTLPEFGKAMLKQGAIDAVNLDGGGSTCLYYRGKMLISTVRKLSNMVVVDEAR